MSSPFTPTEDALLDALGRERELLRERDLVSGIVLHELASAVTVVTGAVSLAKLHGTEDPRLRFALQRIDGGARMMEHLMRGLRFLFESNAGPPAVERGDLAAFARAVVTDPVLVSEDAAARVEMVDRLPPRAATVFHPDLLRHALSNLARNALRYSPADRPVTVIVGGAPEAPWIHVLNRGPRIPADRLESLFTPGQKSPHGGMGFGLHIARTCALRMGGQLVFGTTRRATVFSLGLGPRRARHGFLPALPPGPMTRTELRADMPAA